MQKRLSAFLLVMLTAVLTGAAQTGGPVQKPSVFRFHSINSIGMMANSANAGWLVQSVNGFRYRFWFAGIGAGIEDYQFRGLPVFLDLRRYFLDKPGNRFVPFVFADAGVHIAWPSEDNKKGGMRYDFSNGLYSDLGIGLNMALPQKQALALGLGYSYKSVKYTEIPYRPLDAQPTLDRYYYDYDLNRFSVRLGWQL